MKIAILLSGRTDNFESAYQTNINTLIQPLIRAGHSVDMFASIWDGPSNKILINVYSPYLRVVDVESFTPYTSAVMTPIKEYSRLAKQYGLGDSNSDNVIYWMYKIDRAFKIMELYEEKNGSYDLYIRNRPDVSLTRPIDLSLIDQIDDKTIVTHVDQLFHFIDGKRRNVHADEVFSGGYLYGCGNGWVDDNFCLAKKDVFRVYCGLYQNIVELTTKYESAISHIILQKEFERLGIKTVKPNSTLMFFRPDGVWEYFRYMFDTFNPEKNTW